MDNVDNTDQPKQQYRGSSNQVTIEEIRGQLNYGKKQKQLRKSTLVDMNKISASQENTIIGQNVTNQQF